MSGKSKSARYSESRTDTLLGAGVRISGNITFSGVLRTQGEIVGDVSCATDPEGTVVVAKSGTITGTIKAAHVVVGGRIEGNVDASESIEVQDGASVVGDVAYKDIGIDAGGVVEGTLTRRVVAGQERPAQEVPGATTEPPAGTEYELPVADAVAQASRAGEPARNWGKHGAALAVLVALVAVVLLNRQPSDVAVPVAAESTRADPVAAESPPVNAAPVQVAVPGVAPRPVVEAAAPPPPPEPATRKVVEAPPPERPAISTEQVATVQGDSPEKSSAFLFVIANEPSVLIKKKREDSGEGTRIEVAQGSKKRIAITPNDLLRVAAGEDVDMFFQGRKVTQRTIESGVWMNFVPHSASGAGSKE